VKNLPLFNSRDFLGLVWVGENSILIVFPSRLVLQKKEYIEISISVAKERAMCFEI
jgi:hypothetical protein